MLIAGLYALLLICCVNAAILNLAREEIAFTPSQRYALSGELEPVTDFSSGGQVPFTLTTVRDDGFPTAFTTRVSPMTIWRPRDPAALQHARWRSMHLGESEPLEWEQYETYPPSIKKE